MENSTLEATSNQSCLHCGSKNQTITSNVTHTCYPWVAGQFIDRNFTLEDVNSVVMERNYAGIIFIGIIMILGLVGNGHVLFVFSKRKYDSNYIQDRIHANYRIFVLWLSILSVIMCAVVSPLLIVYLIHPVNFPSNVLCKIFRFVLYFVPVTMSLTLIAIAVDRYLVICRTFENRLTSKHSKLMCVATVVVALILTWPAPLVFGNGKTETGIPGFTGIRCYLEDASMTKLQQYYQVLLVVFFFAVMIVLLVLYTKVTRDYKKILQFRRLSRRYSASTPETMKRTQARQESQRVWIYASVTIGYVGSALPYHILALLFFASVIVDCNLSLGQAEGFYVFIWSYFLSPVIYPIIYGFQDDGFRCTIKTWYKRLIESIKKCLCVRQGSNNEIQNDTVMLESTTPTTSEVFTENTEDIDPPVKEFSRAIVYKEKNERKSELKEILTSIAAITVHVNEGIMKEDINKNSVHI